MSEKKQEKVEISDEDIEEAIKSLSSMTPEQKESIMADFIINYDFKKFANISNNIFEVFDRIKNSEEFKKAMRNMRK